MQKTNSLKSLLLKVLVPGVSIKIGAAYASSGGFEAGQIIELVHGFFEVDDGYGRTETAPSIWNESQKEFDSIFHLFGNDLDEMEDCEILGVLDKKESEADKLGDRLKNFQSDVRAWAVECFGQEVCDDHVERNQRFAEESIETIQAFGCTEEEVMQVVRYVYSRPAGDREQEIGGAMLTMATLCIASDIDMFGCGLKELERVTRPETLLKIRAKQAAKPRFLPRLVSAETTGQFANI